MDLSGILAIAGKPGLHKLVSQTKNGLIVESLVDGKRFPVYAAHQISALEEISMYSFSGEVALSEVFHNMYNHFDGKEGISHKSSKDELLTLMETVLPEYDKERVYVSDIKKLVQWYNSLHAQGILVFDEAEKEEAGEEKTEEATNE